MKGDSSNLGLRWRGMNPFLEPLSLKSWAYRNVRNVRLEFTETNTHQDHVIAHVIGASVFGYFIFDETAFLLLDIGFIWHIYLDGEMGLRPQPVAIAELETDDATKSQLQNEVDAALQQRETTRPILLKTCRMPLLFKPLIFLCARTHVGC